MAHDEYNSGMQSGYSSSLRILRDFDREIEYPKEEDHNQKSWCYAYEQYNTQKDLLYKIYEAIKKDMDEYTFYE